MSEQVPLKSENYLNDPAGRIAFILQRIFDARGQNPDDDKIDIEVERVKIVEELGPLLLADLLVHTNMDLEDSLALIDNLATSNGTRGGYQGFVDFVSSYFDY